MNNQYCEAKTMYEIDTMVFMWRSSSAEMKECDYIASIGLLCEMLNKTRPSKLLINYASFSYYLSTDLISWTADTLYKRMRTLGVDTISITTPELESISDNIAPLFCEEFTHDLTLQVFTQMDKSMDWLSSHKSNNIRVRKKSLFI
jgi:hypothetical protein